MAFTVLYDANVLHPPGLRDLLIRLGQTGLFRACWTEQILDEMIRSIRRRRPDLEAQRLARTRELMCEAISDCLVTGYEALIDGLALPDPDDRHVLAAALRCSAQVVVTSNLSDFPASTQLGRPRSRPRVAGVSGCSCGRRGPARPCWSWPTRGRARRRGAEHLALRCCADARFREVLRSSGRSRSLERRPHHR